MIWNPENECMNSANLQTIQFARLKNLVEHVYNTVPFYKNKFDEIGVKPSDIKSLKDIAKLPFTTKSDLRETYPYGLLAVPQSEIVEIHMSSGTTGTPVVDAYTAKDLDDWSEGMARTLSAAGATHNDTIQNAYGYGLFTGGMGVHHGARKLGATIIPISSGNTQKQLMLMIFIQIFSPVLRPMQCTWQNKQNKQVSIYTHSL